MAGINKVIIVGNAGKDPETRYTADGTAVTNLSIATSQRVKGEEVTEWHNVTIWGKAGEIAGEFVHRGDRVGVCGSLRTEKWQDRDGNDRYTTKIHCNEVFLMGQSRGRSDDDDGESKENATRNARQAPRQQAQQRAGNIAEMEDDIPF